MIDYLKAIILLVLFRFYSWIQGLQEKKVTPNVQILPKLDSIERNIIGILSKETKDNCAEQNADNLLATDTQKLYEQMIENYLDAIRKVKNLRIEYQMLNDRLDNLKRFMHEKHCQGKKL